MTMQLPGRRDALPEWVEYQDTGCDVSPSCLACPLAVCKYDVPRDKQRRRERAERACRRHREGASIDAIAEELGTSRRTVFRYIEGAH